MRRPLAGSDSWDWRTSEGPHGQVLPCVSRLLVCPDSCNLSSFEQSADPVQRAIHFKRRSSSYQLSTLVSPPTFAPHYNNSLPYANPSTCTLAQLATRFPHSSLATFTSPTMASSIRSAAMALPRVSMSRIPLVAFANSHIAPASHANSSHPSAYSSMPARNGRKDPNSTSSWAESAKESAGKLERSAEKLAKTIDTNAKDYLREVKQYDNPEDEVMMELGLAMSCNNNSKNKKGASTAANGHHHHNYSGGKGDVRNRQDGSSTTFEETLVDQVKEGIRPGKGNSDHEQEMASSLSEELKVQPRKPLRTLSNEHSLLLSRSRSLLAHSLFSARPIDEWVRKGDQTRVIVLTYHASKSGGTTPAGRSLGWKEEWDSTLLQSRAASNHPRLSLSFFLLLPYCY